MPAPIPSSALPRTDADKIAWLCLARSRRVGPTTFIRLIRQFGSAPAALEALPQIAADAGDRGYQPASLEAARREWDAGQRLGAILLPLGAPTYPRALYDLTDPPAVLWAKGQLPLLARRRVALVGARNASAVGQRMASSLAKELAQAGFVVVSGLARGIDAAAHRAALTSGTVAVVAGGIDNFYPRETAALAAEIGEAGLRLSEMPVGMAPQARHFPQRNRIVSGLSEAVVVVEGAAKSGSLITARTALDQGRDVMAVPGHPLDPRAGGCNMLIRDGATLIRSGNDVLEALAPERGADPALPGVWADDPVDPPDALTQAQPVAGPMDGLSGRILALLAANPVSEDTLIRAAGAPPQVVLATLAEMTIEGAIDRQPGGLIARAA